MFQVVASSKSYLLYLIFFILCADLRAGENTSSTDRTTSDKKQSDFSDGDANVPARSLFVSGAQRTISDDKLAEISPDSRVDERLFLLRLLERHYEAWPAQRDSAESFTNSAHELRISILRYRQHIIDSNVSPELVYLYTDYVEALEAYTQFLANIGAIKQKAADQFKNDSIDSGLKAGASGAATYKIAQQSDFSDGDAAVTALLISGITFAWDSYIKSQAREQAEIDAINREARRVDDKIRTALGRAQNVSKEMAKQYNWKPKEAGFILSVDQTNSILKMLKKEDYKGLLQEANEQVEQRPRDPFVRNTRNIFRGLCFEEDKEILLACARDSYINANLIPASPVYDEFRLECIEMAGHLALAASELEKTNPTASAGSTNCSRYAVLLWDKIQEIVPEDTTGYYKYFLSQALLADNQVGEAFRLSSSLTEKLGQDSDFSYHYSCVLSRMKESELAIQWLEHAISIGKWDIVNIWNDPELRHIRESKTSEFHDVVIPKWDWSITDDLLWDDVILTNNSTFPLTNVVLDVKLVKDGNITPLKLKAELVLPGETQKWTDIVNGASGHWDNSSSASLKCEQIKK